MVRVGFAQSARFKCSEMGKGVSHCVLAQFSFFLRLLFLSVAIARRLGDRVFCLCSSRWPWKWAAFSSWFPSEIQWNWLWSAATFEVYVAAAAIVVVVVNVVVFLCTSGLLPHREPSGYFASPAHRST